MVNKKVLIAGCANTSVSIDISTYFEEMNYKINTIGNLDNIKISVMLDKPDILFIHFHEFTHNALAIAKELYDKHKIPSIFIVSSPAFLEAVSLSNSSYILACLSLPIQKDDLKNLL